MRRGTRRPSGSKVVSFSVGDAVYVRLLEVAAARGLKNVGELSKALVQAWLIGDWECYRETSGRNVPAGEKRRAQ